jgi:hypothetical protein
MDASVVTSLWSESVAEYVIENSILGKQTVSFAIGVLNSQVVEWSQLILCYSPFSANLSLQKVIVGQSKDSRKLRDTDIELVAFNAEVDGGIIPISTSPRSETELSD